MRNLKRALSLALASVMLLGMMVVGTSAASYPDVDENDNVEAIEVLNAVNVMIGDRGNFRPDAAVNRHEMAVIMAKLVLGVETADNYVGTHPFTDVFPWADKYVAACYENGLVAGTSATTFGGNQPLTAVQAAAMMLRALGYKDLSKGQPDWRAPVTAMANQIRLFNGVASNPSEQLTRNQVAQLALNTLKSPMVNLKDNTISWSNDEGQLIMTGGSREYIALSSNEAYARAINDTERAGTSASQISGYTVELGEHLYNGKLKLNNNNLDVFGRPARKWEYDGKAIGSYIKEELMVMDKVGKVTGNDLYTLLGASTIKDYDTLVTIDGVANDRSDAKDILGGAYFDEADMNRNNKDKVGATGTGVLTQVFVDHEKDEVYVAVINTYLARASKDYDTKAEEATLTVYGIDEYRTSKEFVKAKGSSETMKVQNEDFDLVKDVKKDDPYLVTVADGEIQTMVPDEVLEAVTLTAFKLTDHVVSDGTEYAYTTTATYKDGDLDNYTGIAGNTNLKDMTYNIYLDAYGNLIGIEEVDAVKNYVFLAGIDVDGSNLYSKTATANALFLDGTSKTIKINLSKSEFPAHPELGYTNVVISGNALLNTWCTYTVSGDVYTVKEAYATSANPYSGTTANANNYPQHGDNTTKLAQTWQAMTNTGKVSVKNLRLSGGPTSGNYTNVYGDSTSVYLTAELDELYNDGQSNINGGRSYGIIKGVDSVTTGVADTSIEIWTEAEARTEAEGSIKSQDVGHNSYGIYTLYDSDGIVIASVVIGENEGVKDLVYVHSSSLDLESYDSAKDIWTWTRKVVFKGEEITLTEKGDGVSDLETMKQYQWYEIKRDNDGNILSADPAFHALGEYEEDPDYTIDNTGYFVTRYENINNRVESSTKDTVLYQTSGGPKDYTNDPVCHKHGGLNKDLVVLGSNTLAVETLTGSGIHFRNDVNVVLQYWNQNTKQTEIETGTGVDALKSMVDFVNDNNKVRGGDLYWLSAVIEKGFATTVVIYDSFNNYDRPATELGTYELTLGGVLNSIYTTPADKNSDVYLVDDVTGNITYVESNDSVATSTVNGYKRYTIPYNKTVRIYDNDVGARDFVPFFSPVWAVVGDQYTGYGYNHYEIGTDSRTGRTYLEFSISDRLANNSLTVRERLDTDGIYVGVVKDSKATVTVNGKAWDAVDNCAVVPNRGIIRVKAIDGANVYVNGTLMTPDAGTTDTYTFQAKLTDAYIIISTTGGVTPPNPDQETEITWTGSAVKDTQFTAVENANGTWTVKIAGENKGLRVRDGAGYTAASVGDEVMTGSNLYTEWTITPTAKKITVTVNKAKWDFVTSGGHTGFGLVEDTASSASAPRARMAMARAAGDPVEVKSWLVVTFDGVAGEFVLGLAEIGGLEAYWFGQDEDMEPLRPVLDALNSGKALDEVMKPSNRQPTDDEKSEWNGGSAPVDPVNPEVVVKSTTTKTNAGWTATFTKYIPEDLADDETLVLTNAEIEKALADELTGTWKADRAKGEAVRASDNQKVTFAKNPSATQVYMVTYPGATGKVSIYYNPSDAKTQTVENVNADVKYLLAKDDVYAAAAAYTVADQKVTFTGVTEDVEYVAALMLEASGDYAVTSGAIKNKKDEDKTQSVLEAKIKMSAVNFVTLDKTSTAFVQTGTVITFAQGADVKTGPAALKAGEGVKLEVNGSSTAALEFVANSNGVIETKEWTVPAKAKDATLKFKAIREPVDQAISVYLNDSTTALTTETIDKKVYVKVGNVNIGDGDQFALVYWNDVAEQYDLLSTKSITPVIDTAGVARIERGALASIATTDASGNKVAKIYTAYSVAYNGAAWSAYLEDPTDTTKNVTAIDATAYVPTTNAKIWVEAKGGAHLLMDKDGTGELTGRVNTPNVSGTVKAVYAYNLTKNLAAGDIVPALTFANPAVTGALDEDLRGGVESNACAIDNLTIGTAAEKIKLNLGPAVTVAGASGSLKDAGAVTFTLKQDKADGSIKFTAKSVNDADRSLKAETGVGTATVTINGVTVIIGIDRDARVSTDDAEIVAFVKEQFEGMTVEDVAKKETPDAETDVKANVNTAVTNNGIFAAPFNSVHNSTLASDGFTGGIKVETITPVANGTKGEGTEAGTDGQYRVTYALKSNSVEDTASVVVTVKAMPYAETTAGIAEAAALVKINAVKDAVLNATTGLKALSATAADKDTALAKLKTDVETIITSLSTAATGVTASATAEDDDFQAPADPAKGSLTATVTLSHDDCDDVTFSITVEIPAT